MGDIVYYNIVMTGNPNQVETQAIFEETRTQPLLNKPDDYYMSIIRFSIDGSFIPLFVCPVIPNPMDPTDVNFTPFLVTLSAGGNNYSQNVRYYPESNARLPFPPVLVNGMISQDFSSSYYYIYTYTRFITMVNTALQTAFNNLVAANAQFAGTPAPYFIYDDTNKNISLVVPNIVVAGTNVWLTPITPTPPTIGMTSLANEPVQPQPANTIYLYMNEQLFSYFDGIETFGYYNNPNQTVLYVFRDLKNNYYYPPINGANTAPPQTETSFSIVSGAQTQSYTVSPAWFIYTQQYNFLSIWNSLASIVFTTNNIPVQIEYIPSSAIVNSNGAQSGNISFRSILTDFTPDLMNAGDSRSRFIYNPTGQFRLLDLKSNLPLVKIDLQMWWQDEYNNLYPLFISYNQSNTVKMMFIKKSLANYNYKYY